MSGWWRLIVILYNLFLLALGGAAVVAAMGRPEPLEYINLALSTPENRIIFGTVAVVLVVVAITALVSALKIEEPGKAMNVDSTLAGDVSITVPAVNVIIMKAVKKVQGVRDIKPSISEGVDGLVVKLHMMINPEYPVPEMSKQVQEVVRQHLEETGGLKVSKVRVLVDDFNVANRNARD